MTSRSPGPITTSIISSSAVNSIGPSSRSANHVMLGLGRPSAVHVKLALPGDTTTWSIGGVVMTGLTGGGGEEGGGGGDKE